MSRNRGAARARPVGERVASPGTAGEATGPTCLRCGFVVVRRPWGCKNPCRNCGFVYPLGDCSD